MSDHKALSLSEVAARAAAGHSAFSPSSSKMWLNCSGSLIPNILADDQTSPEAAEGTAAHDLAETWLTKGRKAASDRVGEVMDIDGHEIEITEEMLAYVGDYVDWIEELREDAVEFRTETRVDFSDLTPIPNQGGTSDNIALIEINETEFELVVTDLKYGKGVRVFAEGNTQGLLYGYGAYKLFRDQYNIVKLTIRIAHPRLAEGFTTWTVEISHLLDFALLVKKRAKEAWQWNAPRTPTEEGCQWCKVRGTCPAIYEHLFEVTSDVFDDEERLERSYSEEEQEAANERLEDDLGPEPFRPFKPAELSTTALAKVLRYRKLMEKFFGSIEEVLMERAISREETIPGWKLVEGRANRKWPDDEIDTYKALKKLGLKDSNIYQTKIISPAEAEKKLHAKVGLSTDEATKKVNSLAIKPRGKRSLARSSDSRPGLANDGDVFEDEND